MALDKGLHEGTGDVEKYDAAGGKDTYHGNTYQLRLLTLCMLRGIGNYSFSLATDMKAADKFDDVVFRYPDESTKKHVYRFLQAKHRKVPEKSKVTFQALLAKSKNSDFSLAVYYHSFQKIKNMFVGDDREIRDIIICTNADLERNDSYELDKLQLTFKDIFEYSTMDDILGTELECFRKDFTGKEKLVNIIIDNVSEMIKKENKGKECTDGKKDEIATDIESFMEKLRLAMNQPGVEGLKKEIIDELKYKYNIPEAKTAFSLLEQEMNEWMSKPDGTYLTFNIGIKIVRKLQKMFGDIIFHIEDPVKYFTGRHEQLEILKEAHKAGEEAVVITGLGGVGKSQLVKKFIHENSESFDSYVWMRAESRETLMRSFIELAREKMNIKTESEEGKTRDIGAIRDEVYRYFSRRSCVFVFDNVEKTEEDDDYVKMFLPASSPKPFILMTSRYQSWGSLEVVALDVFSEIEAVELIKSSLGSEIASDDSLVKSLAKELQYYPLALQQAVAYIKNTNEKEKAEYGICQYLEEFQKGCKTLLHQKLQKYSRHSYEYTTAITWDITLNVILKNYPYGHLAHKILRVISYFFPDNIPMADIRNCLEEFDEGELNDSLILLHEYSMIFLKCNEVSIHRLVQMVTRQKIKEEDEEKLLLDSILDSSFNLETQNSISLWEHCGEHDDLLKKHAALPKHIIVKLKDESSLQESYLFGKKHLAKMKELIGQTDERVMGAMYAFAEVTHIMSKYDEAYKLYEEILQTQKLVFDDDHNKILHLRNTMAVIHCDQGLYDSALMIFHQIHNKFKMSLGETHFNTLVALNNIAKVLQSKGKFEEALAIYEELIKDKISQLGDKHESVLATRGNMAEVLHLQGKPDKALDILDDIYKIQLSILGEKNIQTIATKYYVACNLQSTGNNIKALKIFDDLYETQINLLGEYHHDTIKTLQNKAKSFQALGKHSEALLIFDEAYEKLKETIGELHPDTIIAGQNKAVSLNAQGRLDESLKIYRKLYEKMQSYQVGDQNTMLVIRNNMAKVLQDQKRHDEALKMFREVHEGQKTLLGEKSLNTLMTKNNIASLLQLQGKYDEASEIFNQLYDIMKSEFGENSINTLTVRHNMAGLIQSHGKLEEALIVFTEVFERQKIILGLDNPNTLRTMHNIGYVLWTLEKYEDAVQVLQELLRVQVRLYGKEDQATLDTANNLAFCIWKLGRADEVMAALQGNLID